MCSPTCCCAMSLIINLVPVFTVFASVRNAFFTGGKSQGVWWLGVLVFIQATQVQFLGREVRSRFTPPLTAASPRSGRAQKSVLEWALHRCAQIGPFLSHLSLRAPTVRVLLCLSVYSGHQVSATYRAVRHSPSEVSALNHFWSSLSENRPSV